MADSIETILRVLAARLEADHASNQSALKDAWAAVEELRAGGVAPTPSLVEENKRLREALERTEISALNFVGVARNMHRRQIMGLEALEITLKVLDSFKSVARTALRNGEPG